MTYAEIKNEIDAANFDVLIGLIEDEHFEAKSGKYDFSNDSGKLELAKDVSSFANRSGGIIVIGAKTSDNPAFFGRRVDALSLTTCDLINESDYHNVIKLGFYPCPDNIQIAWVPSTQDLQRGLFYILIPNQLENLRPFHKAILEEMEDMESGSTLRLLGISLGAFLCPHGALHGAFRKLLERKDITIEVLILDTNSDSAINRAQFEEPRFFFNAKDVHEAYQHTRCHNELKTATDFAQDLADRCYYRDQKPSGQLPFDAPIEPKINAKFEYLVYDSSPLCYLVIFDESMFLESYHNAGRGGESPVLKISKQSGETTEITSLFKIYEYHYEVMKGKSSKRKENVL